MHKNNIQTVSELKVQDHVVYGSAGVCRLTGEVSRCFDGINKNQYLTLEPVNSASSTYYVPVDTACSKIRKLITRDEVDRLIDGLNSDSMEWHNDSKERKDEFMGILRSHDLRRILGMLKVLHIQKAEKAKDGKRLVSSDEHAMAEGENLVYSEFSLVLGIKYDDVENFISNRIEICE